MTVLRSILPFEDFACERCLISQLLGGGVQNPMPFPKNKHKRHPTRRGSRGKKTSEVNHIDTNDSDESNAIFNLSDKELSNERIQVLSKELFRFRNHIGEYWSQYPESPWTNVDVPLLIGTNTLDPLYEKCALIQGESVKHRTKNSHGSPLLKPLYHQFKINQQNGRMGTVKLQSKKGVINRSDSLSRASQIKITCWSPVL
ncbi:hypothetical protein DPX16_1559 [Anabarilius grahami]|uniref:Uncharacterized protein n=1 Tax=Anabarilius grahami TaxID=495550 RepID=A0A3N0XSM8_ANAGA|nr:hypothetical protein DPX16_1559 [Anabarilius grahami]